MLLLAPYASGAAHKAILKNRTAIKRAHMIKFLEIYNHIGFCTSVRITGLSMSGKMPSASDFDPRVMAGLAANHG